MSFELVNIDPKKIKNYIQLKIILLGDSGCGKSSTLKKYISHEYNDETVSTHGVDLEIKFIKFNDTYIKVFFWDTAGQDAYHYITTNHFRNANGFILFYDITRQKTLDNCENWMKKLYDNISSQKHKPLGLFLGNKIDLNRNINKNEAIKFAEKYKLTFHEISAKKYTNQLYEIINDFLINIYKKYNKNNVILDYNPLILNNKNTNFETNKKNSCC